MSLRRERDGAVLFMTIDRSEAMNALDHAVLSGIREGMDEAANDPSIRVVILAAAGEKAFCAGADLKELAVMGAEEAHRTMAYGQEVMRHLERTPVPVIAAVNGLALGGGFELALAATIPVLADHAQLGLPESGLGLIPGYGGTQRLPRAVGSRVAAHLMLTGTRLSAERAYELGLTPIRPVPQADLPSTVTSMAETIASQGPEAVRSILQAMDLGRDAPLDSGLRAETGLAVLAVAGEESSEGISAFLEHRAAQFTDREETR
ncbi:enoyl-CoA hydratase [Nocardioides albertanoniae]|uniref:enoyl-CoA hydratase n=1 Tax=Nocardioides albertanoniae TaxID=1175486 RepID=A0A543A7W9_9ACTN|nr:enoyl-CoA hydratase-related protein [Nocardioides albertanoniae]TQL68702.1 enoyl-CoA hydratase [Nocardioides albertanoniae]